MRAVIIVAVHVGLLAAFACSSSSPQWSGELKNDESQLSHAQRRFLRSKVRQLETAMPNLANRARTLALLLEKPDEAESQQLQIAAREVARELEVMIRNDADAESLAFASGDFFAPVIVSKGNDGVATHIDFQKREPHLREQVGFFMEGPNTPVDLSGYPKSQFSVAVQGREKMRLRVPIVVRGYYLGDLTGVYAIR